MAKLHAFQESDARLMAGRRGTLLAYETGGGKTAAMIQAARLAAPKGPWFIVTEWNAVEQWRGELSTWAPGQNNFTICHYEGMAKFQRSGIDAPAVIVDEADRARNIDTNIFRTLHPICTGRSPYGPKRVMLGTATPLRNGVQDLFAPMILGGMFSLEQHQQLVIHFTDPQLSGIGEGMDTRGASNLPELAQLLGSFMVRRTYNDFGFRMPAPYFERVSASPDDAGAAGQTYKLAAEDFSGWYRSTRGRKAPGLSKYTMLRRLMELAKIPQMVKLIKADQAAGFSSLNFCEYRETAQELQRQIKGAGLVIGGDSMSDRAEVLEGVATAEGATATIATVGALHSALNMPQIDCVNFAAKGWDPCILTQTAGRAWRQKRKNPVRMRDVFFPGDDLEKHGDEVLLRKEAILKTLNLLPTLNVSTLLNA